MAPSKWSALLALPTLLSASPVPSSGSDSACGKIQSSLQPVPSLPPGSNIKGQVDAGLAWDCLQSIPLNVSAALDLVESLKPYVNFQSNLAFLKNPPDEYAEKVQKPVDVFGELDRIGDKIKSGGYSGEYEFGFELYTVFQSTHDGHFYYVPDVVGKLFSFSRPFPIVSVSEDGEGIPAIFSYNDVLLASQDKSFKPSPIDSIDDEDVVDYLLRLAQTGSLQDRDALWNTLFYSLPQVSLGSSGIASGVFSGGGRGRYFYAGPQTNIKFDNGTVVTVQNSARVLQDFSAISSGQDVYNSFFTVGDMTIDLQNLPVTFESDSRFPSSNEAKANVESVQDVPAPGYPTPIVKTQLNDLRGYYLDQDGYKDVAVLSMQSFLGSDGQDKFQAASRQFLSQAKADGKKKLLIDVSANGGGTIWLGYEIFLELFPNLDPYGGNRFRAHQAMEQIGKVISNLTDGMPRDLDLAEPYQDWVSSPFNFRSDLDNVNHPFKSWNDKYAPYQANEDWYTRTLRWNLNDSLRYDYSGLNDLSGRGLASLDLPWKAKDILFITDGYCASTCTIFAEFLRQQAGVEFLAMGGRPNDDIIQAVGGVKGSNSWNWSGVLEYALNTWAWSNDATKKSWKGTEMATFNSYLPFHRATGNPDLNMRDAVRKGDTSHVPLHFKYEAADCRLYYTADMTMDITAAWRAAVDAKWLGKKQCVAGGFKGVATSSPDFEGDDDDSNAKVRRSEKAKQGRQNTTSISVSQVESGVVDDIKMSLGLVSEYARNPRADAVMQPY